MPRALLVLLLLTLPAPAQDAAPLQAPPPAPLADDEVARIDGRGVPLAAFHAYVGSGYARDQEGQHALRQIHGEALIAAAAERLGVRVGPEQVDTVVAALEERSGSSLADWRGDPTFEASITLLTQQLHVMMAEDGRALDAVLDPAEQQAWLDAVSEATPIEELELTDTLAARFDGGEITRVELGRRILELAADEDRTGLLTEFLGILLIHERARELEVELDPQAAAEVIAERQAMVAAQPELAGLTYEQVLAQTEGLTLEELIGTPRFAAEVLLRQMVDRNWDEDRLQGLFEEERSRFEERLGEGVGFEAARGVVLRDVRQRSYQRLLQTSTIERRF